MMGNNKDPYDVIIDTVHNIYNNKPLDTHPVVKEIAIPFLLNSKIIEKKGNKYVIQKYLPPQKQKFVFQCNVIATTNMKFVTI